MKKIFDYFDSAFCVNLDAEIKKWEYMKNMLAKFNPENKVERLSAVEYLGNSEVYNIGAGMSHKKCVSRAKKYGHKNVLVLEDDVAFEEPFTKSCIDNVLSHLERGDWEYFSASYIVWLDELSFLKKVKNGKIKMLNENVIQFVGCNISSACMVAYNHNIYDKFLKYPHDKTTMDRWNTNNFKVTSPFPSSVVQNDKPWQSKKIRKFNELVTKHFL